MIFGSQHNFAIEAKVEDNLKIPSAVWGKMCVWCQNQPIGDISDPYCALYPAFKAFSRLKKEIGGLWEAPFDQMTDIDLWNLLNELLYGFRGGVKVNDNKTLEELQRDGIRYGKYNFLTNWGEQFNIDGKSFIFLAPDGNIKILNEKYLLKDNISFSVTRSSVLDAINGFVEWFNDQARKLQGK